MSSFEYQVKDRTGKDKAGIQESTDVATLVSELRSQGYIVVRINEIKKRKAFGFSRGPARKKGKSGNIVLDDLVVFSRQMATLVGAGIPLIQALEILAEQVEKDKFKDILSDMHKQIQGGRSFSDSMERHRKVFSELFINMVKAGESSGSLEEILDRVATYLEKTSVLQKKVRSALMYPATVTVMAFLITFFMMSFVIPKFANIFAGIGAELPAATKVLIIVSNFLNQHWLVVLGGIGIGIVLLMQMVKIPSVRIGWDSLKLKMIIVGPLLLKVAISKFSRTLATLIRSGVPILNALEIVSKTSGNLRIEIVIRELMENVKRGESIAGPLAKSEIFPTMVVRMIAIGEETGELEEMLVKIADFYDAEVDASIDGLTSLIEPLIIAFLGIVIGGIVIALFLPIFTLSSSIK